MKRGGGTARQGLENVRKRRETLGGSAEYAKKHFESTFRPKSARAAQNRNIPEKKALSKESKPHHQAKALPSGTKTRNTPPATDRDHSLRKNRVLSAGQMSYLKDTSKEEWTGKRTRPLAKLPSPPRRTYRPNRRGKKKRGKRRGTTWNARPAQVKVRRPPGRGPGNSTFKGGARGRGNCRTRRESRWGSGTERPVMVKRGLPEYCVPFPKKDRKSSRQKPRPQYQTKTHHC